MTQDQPNAAGQRQQLSGRVALVTGASGGLGRHFVRLLHEMGATVVATARRTERLEELERQLGGRVRAHPCDITDDASRQRLVEATLSELGRIDVLVNNAGIGRVGPAEEEDLAGFREVLEVNVVALFHLCQLVGRAMLAAGSGSIINVSSILGLGASAPIKQAGYCASKAAVVNLTRELAAQWARRGVRVNALAPGWIPTEMNAPMWEDEATASYVRRNTPVGRTGEPAELDDAVRFLVSDRNTFYTGQVLVVDGGWTAR